MGSGGRKPRCDWDAITVDTLHDDEALAALYTDACCLDRWPNRDQGVIEFWAWAEALLSAAQTGAPHAVFKLALYKYRWIADRIRHKKRSAAARMPIAKRAALVESVERVAQVESVDADRRTAATEEAQKANAARKHTVDALAMDWDDLGGYLRERAAQYKASKTTPRPSHGVDLNRITAADLNHNGRLAELFILLVQTGELHATPDQALRCVMAAEIALARDNRGTPGALFRRTLRPDTPKRYFTNEMEDRALRRMGGDERHDMVAAALDAEPGETTSTGKVIARSADAEEFSQALVGDSTVGFAHTLFLQCFLPHRALPEGTAEYVSPENGSAWLAVNAGMALGEDGRPKRMEIPSGGYARILIPHFGVIATEAGIPVVTLGRRRSFIERLEIPYGGRSAQLLSQQLLNLLVAQYTLGTFEADAKTERGTIRPVAFVDYAHLRRAIRTGVKAGAFWVPEFRLSAPFFNAFAQHRAPVRIDHLRKLIRRPRAMDIYLFLCYRTRTAGDGATISIRILGDIFAPGLPLFKWRAALRGHLEVIGKVWPHFDVSLVGNDVLRVAEGRPPVRRLG